jgi:hypothetical protein
MRGINTSRAALPQQSPDRGHSHRILLSGETQRREITRKDRTIVQQKRNAIIRVPWRVQDLARDTDPFKHRATLLAGNRDIVVQNDVNIVILSLFSAV